MNILEAPYLSEFLTVALVHLLAVASPGPDFAIIVKQSISQGRKAALWSSLGIGLGIFIHVFYSLLGIGLVISQSITAFNIMKFLGAAYLAYLGVKGLKTKKVATNPSTTQAVQQTQSPLKALSIGFLTNGLNPKATLFFLSLFTVIINPKTPLFVQACYGTYMAVATFIWFSALSLFFGHRHVRQLVQRMSHWFERLMGAALILLSLKLATSSIK